MGRSSEGWSCDICGKKGADRFYPVDKRIWCNRCYVQEDPEGELRALYPYEEWPIEWKQAEEFDRKAKGFQKGGKVIPKNISHKEYLYGDFDKDNIKNVDDPFPFDASKKTDGLIHKAQYVGGDVKLSDALKLVEKNNNALRPFLKSFLNKHPEARGRIKSVPSTIYKLESRYGGELKDRAGARILVGSRDEAYEKAKEIRKLHSYNPRYTRDYYKAKSPNKMYYAIHLDLVDPKSKDHMEVQLRTPMMNRISEMVHSHYKKGADITKYKPVLEKHKKEVIGLTNKVVHGRGRGHFERRLDHSIARRKASMKKWRK